jgi:3alpha(or 20beta)-hydroxysteroid dehydrogenase
MSAFDGKVIVITGAAGGQGAREAEMLCAQGATVFACDLHFAAEPAPDEGPGRLIRHELDVADESAWEELRARIELEHGEVHGLVNNAGMAMRARLGEIELERWNRVFAVNTAGPMLGMQTLLPLMREGASIVNIGSLAGVTAHPAMAYTASKWALRGLSRAASMQLGERGIRVNLVNPGFIETPMTAAAPESFRAVNIANTPLGRVGSVDDVAAMVVFLLSPQAAFISGAEIAVDGGQWAHGGTKVMFDGDRAAGPLHRQP